MVKILIVDDDERLASALEQLLKLEGYAPSVALSAEEALERLKGETYHLVLSDLQMPGRNGIALIAMVREACPETKAVLITGHGSIRTAVTALKRGAVEYMAKPIKPQRLLELIRTLTAELPPLLTNRLLADGSQPANDVPTRQKSPRSRSQRRPPAPSEEESVCIKCSSGLAAGEAPRDDETMIHIRIGTSMEAVERELILRTLAAHQGNKTAAAEVLGISRRSIYNKLAIYGAPTDEAHDSVEP